jgi:hypothetical protein
MNTTFWGPSQWSMLHTVAFNMPEKLTGYHKNTFKQYINILGDILPCKYCRDSYKIFIKEIPVDKYLETRQGVIYWTYQLHDRVNKKLHKGSISLKEVVRLYESNRAHCKHRCDRENIGNFGKCVNSITNQINENELTEYVNEMLTTYEYLSNNPYTSLHQTTQNILYNKYLITLILVIIVMIIYTLSKHL